MYCKNCGSEIHEKAVVCVHCGCAVEENTKPINAVSKKANLSQIFGILSLVLLAPLGIPAIVLAVLSKNETDGIMCGKAKAGFICGIIALCLWTFWIIIWIGVISKHSMYYY